MSDNWIHHRQLILLSLLIGRRREKRESRVKRSTLEGMQILIVGP